MDENAVHHHMILPESYVVHPVGNIPVSMIDYGKVQMPQFIHPGPYYNRVPVIQYGDVNTNPPMGQLHPLELEIQRDFQAGQQQQGLTFSNQPTNSIMHAPTQRIEQECTENSPKPLEMSNVMYDGSFIPISTVPNVNEGIINMNGLKVPNSVYYQPVMKQVMVDKGAYFVVPQTQVVFNNVLNDNQSNVNDVHEQFEGSQEAGEAEWEAASPSELNESDNNVENEETVLYLQLNEPANVTDEGGDGDENGDENEEEDGEEQEANEATLHPELYSVDYNTSEEASPPTELVKYDTNNQKKEEEPIDSEHESDENYEPNSDYESNSSTPENSPDIGKGTISQKAHTCHVCNRKFGLRKNMYFHLRKVHNIQPVIEGGLLCPICKENTTKQEYLRSHLDSLHGIKIEKEERLFSNLNNFLVWKQQVEKETLSSYISKSSPKLLANNEEKTYYRCHRSGSYVSSTVRKKRLKDNGSNKMGATCPAAMEVTENKRGINVTFWKTHVGHHFELSRLPLSKEDRAKILDHLNYGRPLNEIVEHFQSESATNPPTKLRLLTKQDVRNVKKVHELECNPELKKNLEGPKPMGEKTLNVPSPESVIEKADILWELLETTDVKAEFRSKVCLMLDNLISLVKRRGEKVCRRESMSERRKDWLKRNRPDVLDQNDCQNKMKSPKMLHCQRN